MEIAIVIVPNSKESEVIKISENNYKIRIDVPALKNKANKRLIEILSEHFNVSKSSIFIIKGLKSRNKIIKIDL